jgi:hypothetical protein
MPAEALAAAILEIGTASTNAPAHAVNTPSVGPRSGKGEEADAPAK